MKATLRCALLLLASCSGKDMMTGPGPDAATTGDAAAPDRDLGRAGDAGGSDAAMPERTIATTIEQAADGAPFVTVQVSVGGSPPFTAFVDTGSTGLRILAGVVSASDWTVTAETTPNYAYGSGTEVTGVVANAVLTIGGVQSAGPIPVESITAVGCLASKPNCEAAGLTPSTYRFAGTFPAIMGVGMRASPTVTKVASPLASLAVTGRYVMSLGSGTNGTILLDPADTTRFTNALSLTNEGASALPMYSSYDDTQVPFCANSFCGLCVMDTGSPDLSLTASSASDLMMLGVPAGSTKVPSGTVLNFTVNPQKTAFSFTAGTPSVSLGSTSSYSNIGQLPFHHLDVLYDYAHGEIAVAPTL